MFCFIMTTGSSSAKVGNTDLNKSKAASKSEKKSKTSTKNTPTKQGGGVKPTTSLPALKLPPKVLRQVDDKPHYQVVLECKHQIIVL